jgi:large subunit ribosomal protein L16
MALLPSRVKFRKSQRGSRKGTASRGNKLDYGEFGLQTLDRGWIKNNQIEACRVAITRFLKRKGRVFIRIFPHKPVTARPPETRMGKGKGAPEFWVAVVLPGHMLFEVSGVNEATAREACRLAANKLGIRTRFVSRTSTDA